MKIRICLLLGTVILSLQLAAQGLVTLTDEGGAVVNGTLIHHVSADLNGTDTVSLFTSIVGDQAVDIKVRRYEIWPVAGSYNFYCWGTCFIDVPSGTNPTWETPFYENLAPGENYNGFHAYHRPTGNAGTARFRFVWFDRTDPTSADSSWVDIDFGGSVGLDENAPVTTTLEAWPNPSAGNDVFVNYDMNKPVQGAEIVLYNVLGDKVRRQSISAIQGRAVISTTSLGAGVYFANLEVNGRMIATRRVIISR